MVAFNVSADDASPLILYGPAGAWTDSPCDDLAAPLYSQRSWHTSSSHGASATFRFNGTGIWFFGARRPDYGPYNISIDGQTVSGNAQSQELSFQQILGGRSGLSNGSHTAVFTNTGSGSIVDLDSIVFETEIDSADAVTQTTMDDTSPAITYLPKQEDWAFDNNMQGWFNNTHHFTQTNGAQAQFTFNGRVVAIYGTVSPFLADYAVTTDGVTQYFQSSSQGLASSVHLNTLLYFSSSLTSGPHHLTLTANPAQNGQHDTSTLMDIDRIVVFDASNVTTTGDDHGNVTLPDFPQKPVANITSPTIIGIPHAPVQPLTGLQNDTNSVDNASQGYLQQHYSKRHKIAAIGGGIAGTVLLLLLLLIGLLLFRRKHSLHSRFSVRRTPNLPMQPPPVRKMNISSPMPVEEDSNDDLESILAPYTIPLGPNESPFMDDSHPKLPWLPEKCMTRDACNGRSGEFQAESKAWPKTPIRRLRPPSLNLPPLRE